MVSHDDLLTLPAGAPPGDGTYTAAFRSLFVAHHEPLCRYASRLLRDSHQAGDVVQDVFTHLWERRHQWEADHTVVPYLYRAVRNRAFDLTKHRVVVERHARAEQRPDAWGASADDPDEDLRLAELRDAVAVAVNALPELQREAFVLSRYGGLTYAEIAAALGVSVKTVEKRMSVAFRALYATLAPYHNR
jgi:RNA polymerase sigma-70 factor (ECF subfamily)